MFKVVTVLAAKSRSFGQIIVISKNCVFHGVYKQRHFSKLGPCTFPVSSSSMCWNKSTQQAKTKMFSALLPKWGKFFPHKRDVPRVFLTHFPSSLQITVCIHSLQPASSTSASILSCQLNSLPTLGIPFPPTAPCIVDLKE